MKAGQWSWCWCWLVLALIFCPSLSGALPLVPPAGGASQWLDLSHALDHTSRHFPGFIDFNLSIAFNGNTSYGWPAAAHNFVSSEHTGTHMDAPTHIGDKGTWSVDQIPPEHLVGHAAVVDISARCQADPDSVLTPADLDAWRQQHGDFVYPTIVLVRTGQVAYRDDINKYWGLPDEFEIPEVVNFAKDPFPPMHFPAAVVDISARCQADPDSVLTPADLDAWRQQHGDFVYPTIVLVRTGQVAYRDDINKYWGLPDGFEIPEVVDFAKDPFPPMHFPGIGKAAAERLADDEAVVGVGVDSGSLDRGLNYFLEAHHALFARNKFGLENVGDMKDVPATGATIMALPMKIRGGTGGPVRILVRLPSDSSKN